MRIREHVSRVLTGCLALSAAILAAPLMSRASGQQCGSRLLQGKSTRMPRLVGMNTLSCVTHSCRRRLLATALLLALVSSYAPTAAADSAFCQPGQSPQFGPDFAPLKAQLGDMMGDPVECEHVAGGSTDTVQQTTTGLAFHHAQSQLPAFTDGTDHWAIVDGNLVSWSVDAPDPTSLDDANPVASTSAATPNPTAAATPTSPATPAPVPLASAAIVSASDPSVVQVLGDAVEGSGVVVSAGILTNAHVVQDSHRIQIATTDQRKADATIVRLDDDADLALLHTDLPLPPLDIEPASAQQRGDEVLAIGYPLGLREAGGQATVTRGVISDIRTFSDSSEQYVQTDAAINPGSSGGALVNSRGKLIGITSDSLGEGVGLSIGPDTLLAFLALPADAVRPAPPSPLYHGDPRDLACSAADLGSDWQTVRTNTSQLDDGTFAIELKSSSSNGDLQCRVTVLPNTKIAGDYWDASVDDGYQGLSMPSVGDASMGEVRTSSGLVRVKARAKNVIVEVAVAKNGVQSPGDLAVRELRTVLDRANAQAQ
jgi:S1-C subfamily serine protease